MTSTAAIIGGGVIGAGWAARFLLHGWNVRLFDPAPEVQARTAQVIDRARLALPGLGDVALPEAGQLSFHGLMSEAVAGADWVQESVPDRLELKQTLYQTLQDYMEPGVVLGSSTRSFTPTDLQAMSKRPEQIVVAHPVQPVYLLPLVELVGSDRNGAAVMARCVDVLEDIGMRPLQLRAEQPAHVSDRLAQALWREALWLIRDGIATTQEVDAAIRLGLGPTWAQSGPFEAARIAGAGADMARAMQAIAPELKAPWSRLTDVPDMDAALARRIAEQSEDPPGVADLAMLEDARDASLVAILRALRGRNQGAGAVLARGDARRRAEAGLASTYAEITSPEQPVPTVARAVPLDWLDYNGHMTEARYLEVFATATDQLMDLVGCDADYVASGKSFFTVETHIRHIDEVRAGAHLAVTTRVLAGAGKRMHLWHELRSGDRLLATGEHMLLHVDLETRRSCELTPVLAERLSRLAEAQATLPPPEGAGRHIGQGF
ncbi:carnitine 3-dehydrogenase [Pseudooceanicola aestuarii]|uniref:carnitine 3-dehydrogenase n=1 Tax=Pseudooceanicola aestuarii TaxID=2697319 RepID=UPI0013D75DC2|nr:carnitine 3-dehydrogenase [Pseudooceanicola aestuarii]